MQFMMILLLCNQHLKMCMQLMMVLYNKITKICIRFNLRHPIVQKFLRGVGACPQTPLEARMLCMPVVTLTCIHRLAEFCLTKVKLLPQALQ